MKILVTGGAGYVGSVVVEELLSLGYQVIVLDNLQQGHLSAILPEAELVCGDIADGEIIEKIFCSGQISAVMHLAANSLVSYSMEDPSPYFQNNITNGLKLLDTMVKYKVKKFIFSSSAAVYGEPKEIPIAEEHLKCPVNPYGETKLMFEKILNWYSRSYGLNYVALRYFNAAGASGKLGEDHNPETHLIPNVLRAALFPENLISIFGDDYPTRDGTCVRDYIHVKDIAQAHVLALGKISSLSNRAYNLGSGKGHTVKEVIETSRQVTGKTIRVEIKPRRRGDAAVLMASQERAIKELGWNPKFTELETILASSWNWMLDHKNGYDDTISEAVVMAGEN